MKWKIEEIKELLTLILRKLDSIKKQVKRQEETLKTYIKEEDFKNDSKDNWLKSQRSTITLLAVLTDEIEELHQVIITLFNENKTQIEKLSID